MMSAVNERSRRATAGKRLHSLVGQAQEDDDAFWGHETWQEDAHDQESYSDSDEKDEFDSDFDETEESEDEEDQRAQANQEDLELMKEERKRQVHQVARAGRLFLQKKRGKIKGNRIFGDGINAGLVLNAPGSAVAVKSRSAAATAALKRSTVTTTTKQVTSYYSTTTTTRIRRRKQLRSSTLDASKSSKQEASLHKKRKYTSSSTDHLMPILTQDDLLIEAATITEPENEIWLLERKRMHQEVENTRHSSSAFNQTGRGGKLLQRYLSKRGYTTLTFCDMNAVPDVLVKNHDGSVKHPTSTTAATCVITGLPARYKCPKTNLPYHDLQSFRELRRRLETKEELDQRSKQITTTASFTDTNKEETKDIAKAIVIMDNGNNKTPEKKLPTSTRATTESTTTTRSSTPERAIQTVQDPDRKLTMRTRMATKFSSCLSSVAAEPSKMRAQLRGKKISAAQNPANKSDQATELTAAIVSNDDAVKSTIPANSETKTATANTSSTTEKTVTDTETATTADVTTSTVLKPNASTSGVAKPRSTKISKKSSKPKKLQPRTAGKVAEPVYSDAAAMSSTGAGTSKPEKSAATANQSRAAACISPHTLATTALAAYVHKLEEEQEHGADEK
jgi:vacuolar protein sorting-associated protein 72